MIPRRAFLGGGVGLAVALTCRAAWAARPTVTVYRDPT
jgi:hypothetical protein